MKRPILYMAPLKGLTDHLFRTAFATHFAGFDLAVAPFISTRAGSVIKPKYLRDVWPQNNPRLPVVPQILSKSAPDFILLANALADLGYAQVNWNLGCPFPMVANKKRGAGLLPYTERIDAILDQVVPNIGARLSVKVRLGWQTADELLRLLPVFARYPLAELIIHPRTGEQRYDGTVDLDAFERCLPAIACPVVYNGDIVSPEGFARLAQRFDTVERWMIGRGCLADPFLIPRIKNGDADVGDRHDVLQRFHADLFEAYSRTLSGPAHVMNKMKGVWRYLSGAFAAHPRAVRQIMRARRPDDYLRRVALLFDRAATAG